VALRHLVDVAGHDPKLRAPDLALVLPLGGRRAANFVHGYSSLESLV
jgi:hypothetical protein